MKFTMIHSRKEWNIQRERISINELDRKEWNIQRERISMNELDTLESEGEGGREETLRAKAHEVLTERQF